MNSPTPSKYTGLIMAFGASQNIASSEAENPHFIAIAHLLGEYSFKVLNWESMKIRDRSVTSFLIEIHPDHTVPLDEDLQKLATELGIDIASEYQAFTPATVGLAHSPWIGEVVIAGSAITSSLSSSVVALLARHEVRITSVSSQRSARIGALTLAISMEAAKLDAVQSELKALGGAIALHDQRQRGAQLFVFDMDSTLINEEVIDLLAAKSGKGAEVASITEAAMKGEMDFATSLAKRVSLLAGLNNSGIDEVRGEVTLTPGVQELFTAIHKNGGLIAVVSGGFHNVIDPLLKDLGVDYILANTLETTEAGLTGKISGRLIDASAKAEFLRESAAHRQIQIENTVAVGDGANDREMITTAGIGIAFCAKPALVEVADVVISERDLGVLIPLLAL